jgi:hypothetical protein
MKTMAKKSVVLKFCETRKKETRRAAFRPAVGTRKPNSQRTLSIGENTLECNTSFPLFAEKQTMLLNFWQSVASDAI